MKKIWLLSVATCLVAVAIVAGVLGAGSVKILAVVGDPEPDSDRVIFISDDYSFGNGSGSDASNPLRPVDHESFDPIAQYPKWYLQTAFYQATEMLQESGGTIVICGSTYFGAGQSYGSGQTTKDVYTAFFGNNVIKFTSVYDGVDYRKTNGAKIIIETPATISVQGSSVWENVDIVTAGANRTMSFCGYETLIGAGVSCYPADPAYKGVSAYHVSLSGGARYAKSDGQVTSLTVRSGTYGDIVGGILGVTSSHSMTNAVTNLTLEGTTTVYGQIIGTVKQAATFSGHVNIIINGGVYECDINMVGSTGMLNADGTAYLEINGGSFENAWSINTYAMGCINNIPRYAMINMSGWQEHIYRMSCVVAVCTEGWDVIYVPEGVDADKLYDAYYSNWPLVDGVYVGHPDKRTYYVGEEFDTTGMYLDISYTDGKASRAEYGLLVNGFDSSTPGTKNVTVCYDEYVAVYSVEVISPTLKLAADSLTFEVGESITLWTLTYPEVKTIYWESSNPDVASVSEGKITAISPGHATITAMFSYKGRAYKSTCEVNVIVIERNPLLIIGNSVGRAGDTVEVIVSLEDSAKLRSISIKDITYNPTKLSLVSAEWIKKGALFSNWNAEPSGTLIYREKTDLNGNLAKLTFKIADNVGEGDISIGCTFVAIATGEQDESIPVVGGKITVVKVLKGDVDGDCCVSSDDAIYLLYNVLFGAEDYPLNQNCDYDGNGNTDSDDAIYLLYNVLFGEEGYPLK